MDALTHLWTTLSESVAALLLRWSWQALLLLGGAWLAARCYRSKAPALRHQLWLSALIAVTVLPLWAAVIHWVPVPQPTSKALIYLAEMPISMMSSAPEPMIPAEPDTPRVDTPAAPFRLWPLLLAAWLVGALIALGRLLVFYVRLRRARMKAQPVSLCTLCCDDLKAEWPMAVSIPIKTSSEVRSPILTGVLRPMILLPADITTWTTPEERRAMLQHELAHFQRRDHYVNCFQSWLGAVFFFHPLVRYACRQLHLEREMACDDDVLSLGTTAVAYAESLLKVAERNLAPIGLHEPAFLGSKKTLERRIEMIMNQPRSPRETKRWPWLALPVILLSAMIWLLVPVSGESMGQLDQVLPLMDAQDQQVASPSPPSPQPVWAPTIQDRRGLPPPPPPPPPDPLSVVVTILKNGSGYKLNALDVPSLEVLGKELHTALDGRPANKKMVLIKAPKTIAKNEMVKVINVIKEAGGKPIGVIKEGGGKPISLQSMTTRPSSVQGQDTAPPPPPPPSPTPKVIRDSGMPPPPPPAPPRVIRDENSPFSVRVEQISARSVRISLIRDGGKSLSPQPSL